MESQVQNEDEKVLVDDDPLKGLTKKEADVAAKLLPKLTAKIASEADVRYGQMYRDKITEMQGMQQEALKKAIDEMREVAKPLDDKELQMLLSQEYTTFPVKLAVGDAERTFTIRELTGTAEKKIIKTIQGTIAPIMKAMSSAEWTKLSGASQADVVTHVVGLVPEAMTTLYVCVATALNPTGVDADITGEWVEKNLGMNRCVLILLAQISACRYRDFFSLGFRLFQQSRMLSL